MKLRFVSSSIAALVFASALAAQGAAAEKKPTLIVDGSGVADGIRPGVVVSYADVIEPVQKAVVSVYSTKTIRQRMPVSPLFRQFFGDQIPERESKERGLGSGVIVSPDGYIITNNHVVEGADELNVLLPDEREFKAKVIGSDPKTDIAIIKIESENLPTITLADSDILRVGDVVFAIGNPLDVGQTVTQGIVSAKSRRVGILDDVAGYEDFIQTDAAINQGNSGGALVDAKGRLIGINSAIISTSRGSIGIGFAIPINLAASIMHSLINTGTVARGYLGVAVGPMNADLAETLGLKRDTRGVIVTRVIEDSPAANAGLQQEDVVLSIDGKTVTSRDDLRLLVSQKMPDTNVKIRLLRAGKEQTIDVKLGALMEEVAGGNEILPGVTVTRLTAELRRSLNIDDRLDGLVVTEVAENSPYRERLRQQMVILQINRLNVSDTPSARQALKPGANLFFVYLRGAFTYLRIDVN